MDCVRKAMRRFPKQTSEERSPFFLKNGSMLLEELITTFNGRYEIPIQHFTAKELLNATKNFVDQVTADRSSGFHLYRGFIENRQILVKKYRKDSSRQISEVIRDIAIASQMGHHKNVLKLLGCCLEFEIPATVYEDSATEPLSDLLNKNIAADAGRDHTLALEEKIRIAKGIANVLVYLHSGFPVTIIHKDVKPHYVLVDQNGVAKLTDFSLCISLPPGESQVEVDSLTGTYHYAEPEYVATGIVTEKCDVYGYGVFLAVLFTGKTPLNRSGQIDTEGVVDSDHEETNKFVRWVSSGVRELLKETEWLHLDETDGEVVEGGGEIERARQSQLLAFRELAWKCIMREREDRPTMLEVAKEVSRIEKSVLHL